jgi:hypothetical protein
MSDTPKYGRLPGSWLDNMPDPLHTVEDVEELMRIIAEIRQKREKERLAKGLWIQSTTDQFLASHT